MNEPRQKIMETIGKTGCYFLAIVHAAELSTSKVLDAVAIYLECVRRSWMGEDCFVNDPATIFGYLVGGSWQCRKEAATYKPIVGDIVILRYERKTVMETIGHFVCGDAYGNVEYDPYGKSMTVANGQLISMRIISRV